MAVEVSSGRHKTDQFGGHSTSTKNIYVPMLINM